MLFKPIPKKLLVHSVIYEKQSDNTAWGGKGNQESVTINRVRFEPDFKTVVTGLNQEHVIKGILYMDACYSEPFIIPKVDDVIIYKEEPLTVVSCEVLYTLSDTPHHVEVTLV